jgi:hypothetical protein
MANAIYVCAKVKSNRYPHTIGSRGAHLDCPFGGRRRPAQHGQGNPLSPPNFGDRTQGGPSYPITVETVFAI